MGSVNKDIDYNSSDASYAARLSELAYQSVSKIKNEFPDNKLKYIDQGAVQFFVLEGRSETYITFKGTNPSRLIEVLTDLDFVQKKAFVGKVHKGFFEAFSNVKKDLDALVLDFELKRKNIIVSGHSLGGALATLCSAYLHQEGVTIKGVYTFGQPRIGNEDFADYYDSILGNRHFSVFHKDDRIPRLPASKVGRGKLEIQYHHVGKTIWINHEGKLYSAYLKSKKTANKVIRVANTLKGHSVEMYKEVMFNNIEHNPFSVPAKFIESDIKKRKLFKRKS